jgi:hypothetical protein
MYYSRLIISLSLVAVPAYLWVLLAYLSDKGIFLAIGDSTVRTLTQYFVAPLFFSIPWILFIYLNRNRLADTLRHMNETATVIPLRWRVFYGFNTLIILLFFVLPFFSPVLAVLGGVVLAGRIYFGSRSIKAKRKRTKTLILLLLLVVLGGLPTLVLMYFVSSYITLSGFIGPVWVNRIDYIYDLSLCIGDALAFGSLLWFIYAGAAEFEFQTYGMYVSRAPAKLIRLVEVGLFIIIAYIGLPYLWVPGVIQVPLGGAADLSTLRIINIVSLAIVGVIFLISTFRGLRRKGEKNSAWGLIFLLAFLAIELSRNLSSSNAGSFQTIAVFGAAVLFSVMFFISFRKVGSTQ